MKVKVLKSEFPFYGKYENNQVVHFDYFGRKVNAIITANALKFFNVIKVNVGDELEVVRNVTNKKISYVVRKIYQNEIKC